MFELILGIIYTRDLVQEDFGTCGPSHQMTDSFLEQLEPQFSDRVVSSTASVNLGEPGFHEADPSS